MTNELIQRVIEYVSTPQAYLLGANFAVAGVITIGAVYLSKRFGIFREHREDIERQERGKRKWFLKKN